MATSSRAKMETICSTKNYIFLSKSSLTLWTLCTCGAANWFQIFPPKLKKLHVYKYYNSKIPSLPDGLEELRLEDYSHPLPHLPSSLKHLYIVCSHPKPVPIRSFPPGLLTLSVRSSPTDPLRKILPVFPNLPESLQKLELWCEVSEYLYLPPTLRHLVIGKNKYDLPPYPLTLEYLQTYACWIKSGISISLFQCPWGLSINHFHSMP